MLLYWRNMSANHPAIYFEVGAENKSNEINIAVQVSQKQEAEGEETY